MQVLPISAVPSQTVNLLLGTQDCRINIYQKETGAFAGLFVDLYVNDALLIGGVVAENANRIVRSGYLGFAGDLVFYDTQGAEDPSYESLGSRFILCYLLPAELP